jgi:hypothetical protein
MKKVLLICTNENHEIASVDVCDTKEQAVELMRKQYETEMAEVGFHRSVTSPYINVPLNKMID